MSRTRAFAFVLGLALVAGSTASSEIGKAATQTEVRPVHWHVNSVDGRRSITLSWPLGTCSRNPPPRVERVKIAWRSKLRGKFRAVITVFVRVPVTPATVEPEPGVVYPVGCQRLLRRMQKRIRLARPIAELMLFDGSISPPPRREIPIPSAS